MGQAVSWRKPVQDQIALATSFVGPNPRLLQARAIWVKELEETQ